MTVSKDRLLEILSGIRECWILDDNDLNTENKHENKKKLEYMDEQQKNIWNVIERI